MDDDLNRQSRNSDLSYKFQRLRERIRQAVTSGELKGKLPGERELARRFHVNAKTLSKALTDLAAEGLLQRSIGRGTFVRGSQTEHSAAAGPWLLIVDGRTDHALVEHLKALNPGAEICSDICSIRPSFLSHFAAVIDLASRTAEAFVRDLLIRGMPVVTVGTEARTYSTNAVVLDATLGAAHLTRELVLAGHRNFLAIEDRGRITIAEAIRRTAARYCSDYCVDACFASDVGYAMESGATACICDSVRGAVQTLHNLNRAGIEVPRAMSVAAVGWTSGDCPCTGYFADAVQQAAAVAEILRSGQPGRPTTLWLSGAVIDRGTTASPNGEAAERRLPASALSNDPAVVAQ
ncbi:MAG TPA: GntR family transcriptional regulator [Tepidisphaeraceae bacterium]|jgi:DNA-binding transcriptional regulator YhcF (GntR family)|nr:GntR family transcriptional regulator [Tepidisphaeraceae bacterium]